MRKHLITAAVATLAVGSLGGIAVAATNTVSTKPPPASVTRFDERTSAGSDDPARHNRIDESNATPTSSNDDRAPHDVGDDNGVDDPATHDVGDDNGVDDPATHDVGDDNGGRRGGNDG